MPEMAVDTMAVEPTIDMNRMERTTTGLFIIRNLDNKSQNYAKLKFNTKFILDFGGFHLFNPDQEHRRNCSLAFFIRWFDGLYSVH
jgi:hypothetical protein